MGAYKNGNPITGGSNEYQTLLELLYPVGSIFLGVQSTCPLQTLGIGTWELVGSNMALWGSNGSNAGSTLTAGLPNITGRVKIADNVIVNTTPTNPKVTNPSGCFNNDSSTSGTVYTTSAYTGNDTKRDVITFNASSSNSIYGKSNTVQPPAYVVNIWKRVS